MVGLCGASSGFFQPAGILFLTFCLEKKDLGTELDSWKELDWDICWFRELSGLLNTLDLLAKRIRVRMINLTFINVADSCPQHTGTAQAFYNKQV